MNLVEPGIAVEDGVESRTGRQTHGTRSRGQSDRDRDRDRY